MHPAVRFMLITLGTTAIAMVSFLVSCLVTHVFDPLHFWAAGLVGLNAGLMAAWKRHKQDRAAGPAVGTSL